MNAAMQTKFLAVFLLGLIFISGCASFGKKKSSSKDFAVTTAAADISESEKSEPELEEEFKEYTSNEFPDLNNIIIKEQSEAGEEGVMTTAPVLPSELNKRIADWIQFFTVKDRDRTERFFERGLPLLAHIEKILKENDVPPEFFYLAMIESGFIHSAKSRAKAVGTWQFMRGTAKNYGLVVNTQLDERRNWIKATEAAASYLKDLKKVSLG